MGPKFAACSAWAARAHSNYGRGVVSMQICGFYQRDKQNWKNHKRYAPCWRILNAAQSTQGGGCRRLTPSGTRSLCPASQTGPALPARRRAELGRRCMKTAAELVTAFKRSTSRPLRLLTHGVPCALSACRAAGCGSSSRSAVNRLSRVRRPTGRRPSGRRVPSVPLSQTRQRFLFEVQNS